MISAMNYLRGQIPLSDNVYDRAIMTDIMNLLHIGDIGGVEKICLKYGNGDRENLEVVCKWVLILIQEPGLIYQVHKMVSTNVVSKETPKSS